MSDHLFGCSESMLGRPLVVQELVRREVENWSIYTTRIVKKSKPRKIQTQVRCSERNGNGERNDDDTMTGDLVQGHENCGYQFSRSTSRFEDTKHTSSP